MSAKYTLEFAASAEKELYGLRAFDARKVVDAIERELPHHPDTPTKNRKRLDGIRAGFEHAIPLWELRVGNIRVFYDIDKDAARVVIRAVRVKGQGQTTEDVTT